jgi:FkbM family methyltransferase
MDKERVYAALNKIYFSPDKHEQRVVSHLPSLLSRAKVFVDVGASLGQYTFYANQCMTDGHIIAIEADPIRFEELERNCRQWEGLSSNKLTVIHAAVGDRDGEITFYTTNSTLSGGLFIREQQEKSSSSKKLEQWQSVTVNSITLNTLFSQTLNQQIPDIVKVDVEGSELRVLKGSRQLLELGQTRFLVELHNWDDPEGQNDAKDVHQFMASLNYIPSFFQGQPLFVKRKWKKLHRILWTINNRLSLP